jgi:DNA-binding protein
MSDESNSDARDILSELGNSEINSNNVSNEQVTSEITESVQPESDLEQAPNLDKEYENVSKSKTDEKIRNVIFVGNKTIMIYVNSTLTQLSSSPIVTIKARGKRITQAVDISQFIIKRMDSVGYEISDVRISSESLVSQDGKRRNVSLLEIDITNTNF